jgi:hypothetical protein
LLEKAVPGRLRFTVKTFLSLLLVVAASAFVDRVCAQTDSTGWKQDMRTELAAWHATPTAVDLEHFHGKLPLGVRLDLTLRPNAELKFLVAPHRVPKPAYLPWPRTARHQRASRVSATADTPLSLKETRIFDLVSESNRFAAVS